MGAETAAMRPQGMGLSEPGEGKERFSSRTFVRSVALSTPRFLADLHNCDGINVLSQATKCVAICYNSPRKVIPLGRALEGVQGFFSGYKSALKLIVDMATRLVDTKSH